MSAPTDGGDLDGLRAFLGYSALGARTANLLYRAGITSPAQLKAATHGDLTEVHGSGQKSLDLVIESLGFDETQRSHRTQQ